MSVWTGLKRAVAVLASASGTVSRAFTGLNGALNAANRSLAEYNRSLEARLEAEKTPALEAEVKILEAGIACPDFFGFSPRQVAGKRKELLLAYEALAGRLAGEAAADVLLKMQRLRAELGEKTAG